MIKGDLELVPTSAHQGHVVVDRAAARGRFDAFRVEAPETGSRHVDEKWHVAGCAQVELDRSQEIVGLENQNHLPVDKCQHVGYFFYVPRNILFDFLTLQQN